MTSIKQEVLETALNLTTGDGDPTTEAVLLSTLINAYFGTVFKPHNMETIMTLVKLVQHLKR